MKTETVLTSEKFQEIYSNEKFRNDVAFAHGREKANGEHDKITCSYPVTYVVTDEQIAEAKKERERAKEETYAKHQNDLLFVGMGVEYEARYNDDVCNHRIRTEFLNKDGKKFFIEVGTARGDEMRCDHSVDRDLQDEYESKKAELREQAEGVQKYSTEWNAIQTQIDKFNKQVYYNYLGLERSDKKIKYTKQNILKLVNKKFGCNFKNIVIDNYNIHCDDRAIICTSPK